MMMHTQPPVFSASSHSALRRAAMIITVLCGALTMIVSSQSSSGGAAPVYTKHIAPIMFEYCAACHHPGGSGPFSLLTYDEVRRRGKQISVVTHSRYMPPWPPEPGLVKFVGERRLSDEQLRLIERWVDDGMPQGEAKDMPPVPQYNAGWQLGTPDLIVKMDVPFIVPAEGTDVFRNFVLPVPVTATKYVKAVEMLPGNKQVVHHANILIDRNGNARRLDQADPGPGFGGMELTIAADSFEPDSHFLFWKPGTVPWTEPEGMAWRCDPGTDLVLNMHLQPSGKPERIQAEIGLYFTDKPQTLFPMLLQLERDGALDIPPGKNDFVVTDEFTLPVDVEVLGIYPHAHYLGKRIEAWAVLPDGTRQWLIRIANWDLNWQAVYKYEQPIILPKGSVVMMHYSYDNSAANPRNPNHPPKRVRAGNRSSEEMSHLWLQVLPRTKDDARPVLQEALMRQRLRKYPADFTAHFNLGAVLQATGRATEAIAHFRQALQADPDSYLALTSLGATLQERGDTEEAMSLYQRALLIKPDYTHAHYNLGNLLLAAGRVAEALPHYQAVLRQQPQDAGAHNSIGSALAMQGKADEAITHFQQALQAQPDNADVHMNLAYVLAQQGRAEEAAGEFARVLSLDPRNADACNELGVLRGQQGRIAEAVRYFEQALRINPDHKPARENLRRARGRQ